MIPIPVMSLDSLLVHTKSKSLLGPMYHNSRLENLVVEYLSIAISLSSSLRNLARMGESGIYSLNKARQQLPRLRMIDQHLLTEPPRKTRP
jgi:hypothetical protein